MPVDYAVDVTFKSPNQMPVRDLVVEKNLLCFKVDNFDKPFFVIL